MDAWAQIVLGAFALTSPVLGYLLAIRKASGRVGSSDASQLWAEARALRSDQNERIRVLEQRLEWQEKRVMELVSENNRLLREAAGDIGA
jgi:hypothetical protein